MRILFFILIALLIAFSGMFLSPRTPLPTVLAGVVAYLVFEVLALRRRLTALEETMAKMRQAAQAQEPMAKAPPVRISAAEKTRYQPEVALSPDRPVADHAHSTIASLPPQPSPAWDQVGRLLQPLLRYFTQGNPVLKVGIVIVFFGVAFLLKYAAQRDLIPIELRLTGVALGGIGLLVLGWVLRRKHQMYGLGLEGGGIGVLYLCVFAAAKLYHLLPFTLALAVMIGLVGLSCALAVLQDSRGLAAAGSIGGFLAPVLLSTGTGSHVLLFSYYALLNCGILGIAWFKAWRELNLIGFVFTFGIGALWGASAYVPAYFATTEPFLILFFLMYAAIAVLFAHRQPLKLRGFIDGPLVFGLPIVTGGLQAALVHDFRYGLAVSALFLGLFYTILARLLWNRLAGEMRMVTEAFLALGAVFASLAIPFGLDPEWTTAAWALEGAAMVWVGIRQNRRMARLFGLLLQLGAAVTFIGHSDHPSVSLLFANRFFLGCALIAAAGLFSNFWLTHPASPLNAREKQFAPMLLAWGLAWWYSGGYRDLDHHLSWNALPPAFLLFSCLTTAGLGLLIRRFSWQEAAKGLLLLLPIMMLTLASQTLRWNGGPLLTGYGWIAWPVSLVLQYGLLKFFEDVFPKRAVPIWHMLSLWLLILAITVEIAWRVGRIPGINAVWATTCWGLVPAVLLSVLEFKGDRLAWPVRRFAFAYHRLGTDVPVLALLLWTCASFSLAGDPAPLPYLPICNPLELIELVILLLAAYRSTCCGTASGRARQGRIILAGVLFFCYLNVVIGRSVHFFTDTAYQLDTLFHSPVFQAAIAALWAALALSLTVGGAQKGVRHLWLAGAVLLAMVVLKLFLIDLSGAGTIGRIVSFLVVGLLMLVIGFFAPLPPKSTEQSR